MSDPFPGYIGPHEARKFLGGRSMSWLRSHLHEIPHLKLYDRILFDRLKLQEWVEQTAVKCDPVDVDSIVIDSMKPAKKREATG